MLSCIKNIKLLTPCKQSFEITLFYTAEYLIK